MALIMKKKWKLTTDSFLMKSENGECQRDEKKRNRRSGTEKQWNLNQVPNKRALSRSL